MFKNLNLSTKLTGGFLVVTLIALVIGIFGYYQIHKLDKADIMLYQQIAVPMGQLSSLSTDFQRIRVNARDILRVEKEDREEFSDRIEELFKAMDKEAAAYQKTIFSDRGTQLFKEFRDAQAVFTATTRKVINLAQEEKLQEATQTLTGETERASRTMQTAIIKMLEGKIKQGQILSDANIALANRSGWTMLGLAILGAVLAFVLGTAITRSVTGPVKALAEDASRVAEGDLQVEVAVTSQDEIGRLGESFRRMTQSLKETIRQVSETAGTVTTASHHLSITAEELAAGTEKMAAQTGTVAVASEEMSATSNDIARNCHAAADSAGVAACTTQSGFDIVRHTVNGIRVRGQKTRENAVAITNLGERSEQIGAIVGTIEDIADQTNLLALNAAIEAARAGEMGRGFAVVADEVRALAERTTRATKEISEMIRAIQQETRVAITSMEEGIKATEQEATEAAQLETSLQQILDQVNDVTMQVSQIATAAEEQTATTGEVTTNIQQITEVVQQTASGAEETAAAAEQLAGQAQNLQQLVSRFRL